MTKEQAVALYESHWWVEKEATEIALFQLCEDRLCLPFPVFHEAVERALGRPVWTHEFAHREALKQELLKDKPAPSMEEIVNLIPENKRIILVGQ